MANSSWNPKMPAGWAETAYRGYERKMGPLLLKLEYCVITQTFSCGLYADESVIVAALPIPESAKEDELLMRVVHKAAKDLIRTWAK